MVVISECENANNVKKEEQKKQDCVALQCWMLKQPHFPKIGYNERFFRRFLHACNGSQERAKNVIELYFTLRAAIPELFERRDPARPEIQEVFNLTDMIPLPVTTPEGYTVQLYRLADTDATKMVLADWLKVFLMMGDMRMAEEDEYMANRKRAEANGELDIDTSKFPKGCRARYDFEDGFSAGDIPLYDVKGFTLSHLAKVASPVLKKFMTYAQEAHPVKLRGIHIMNTSPIVDKLMGVVRPFMKAEMAKMLHFHTPGSTTLYKYIPKEILPADYGGNVETVAAIKEKVKASFEDRRAWFFETDNMKADESKRQDSRSRERATELFGMEGSFRKLSID
ncbi:alpha-tocopherol transfer protein-like [Ischnura elegans]|uniref:alpha-tocopherol transfer protein-like n=1 Tax=Ischnura elegans TaxID=197161 RepID=UPI001ED8B6AC|nr:alpha-tocopherol transfer protein-like [Ischnura elegans]